MAARKPARKLPVQRRTPKPGQSQQRAHKGGSFDSEQQRQYMWAVYPKAAKKWAHNKATTKADWKPMRGWNRAGSTYRWRLDGRRKKTRRRARKT